MMIREYKIEDKEILLSFIEKLQDYVVAIDPIKRIHRGEGYGEYNLNKLLQSIATQKGKIYMAEVDGKVIGFVSGVVLEQTKENLLEVTPTKLGVVLDLYVDESYREKHVGTKLLQKIADYLQSVGYDSLWLDVFAPNKKAHAFYKKFGFVDREIGMLKKL